MLDLLRELTRRKVWLFGGIYLALGWVMLQVAIAVEATMNLPDWIDQSVLVLLIIGFPFAVLLAWAQESQKGAPSALPASVSSAEEADTRPGFSVAVLPFDDLSQTGAFAAIADGAPEDILTHLSFYSELIVAARNSSFGYKGKSPDIREVGADLGVRFVLEGSIRKIGDEARITAQLNDTLTGAHVWSENYDRPLESLETSSDDIVDQIVYESWTAITTHEEARLLAMDIEDLSGTDLLLLTTLHTVKKTLPRLNQAKVWVEKALELAPDDPAANAAMASIYAQMPIFGSGDREKHWSRAITHLEKARQARVPLISMLIDLARATGFLGQLGDRDIIVDQMMQIAPKHPATWGFRTHALMRAEKYEEALEANARATELCSIRSPFRVHFIVNEADISLRLGDFAKAEVLYREHLNSGGTELCQRLLVIALAHQGKLEAARVEVEALKKYWQDITLARVERMLRSSATPDENIELQIEGLRLAGVE